MLVIKLSTKSSTNKVCVSNVFLNLTRCTKQIARCLDLELLSWVVAYGGLAIESP